MRSLGRRIDPAVAGLDQAVDAERAEPKRHDREQDPAVGLLLQGLERALQADDVAGAEAPGRDDEEAADDQEDDATRDQAEAADRDDLSRVAGAISRYFVKSAR